MDVVEMIRTGENHLLRDKLKNDPSIAVSKTAQGISLLQFAAYCRNTEAVKLLRLSQDEIDIFEAASIGEEETLLDGLERDPDRLNAHSVDGFSPLGLASFFGHMKLVKILLARGADPNIASNNSFNVTPLHSACAISDYVIADILIKNGADVNARQMQGVTPLHSAAHNGQAKLAKLIIDNGADVHAKMDTGQTPLSMAVENGDKDTIALLKKYTDN